MTDEEVNEFNSAVRMIDFKTAHPDLFTDNPLMMSGFTALEAAVPVLETAGANRLSARGSRSDGTADKRAALADIYALIRKTVETAKLIKKEQPDFNNTFKIRRGTLGEQEILDAARAFADDLVAPVAARFGAFGAASVKASNFTARLAAYETARAQQSSGRSSGVAATAQTKAASAEIKKTRRTIAKIGENIIDESGDEALLAEWRSACRVEKRKRNDPDDAPPAPAA